MYDELPYTTIFSGVNIKTRKVGKLGVARGFQFSGMMYTLLRARGYSAMKTVVNGHLNRIIFRKESYISDSQVQRSTGLKFNRSSLKEIISQTD